MPTDCSECPCHTYPWSDECYDCCAGKLIRFAKPEELVSHLRIRQALADKLFELSAKESLVKLSDFKPFLNDKEMQVIEGRLTRMDREALNWIRNKFLEQMGAQAHS